MAQFTIYKSSDAGAVSASLIIHGNAGSMITVMDACLVDGYTGKSAAGWTHPVATASNIASYKQASGSGFGFVLNDNAPNATSLGKEAWARGWEVIAGVGSPGGSGTNQFPTAAQLLSDGHVVIRKSVATGTTAREWIVAADGRTAYLFVLTGDTAGVYYCYGFGDCYSLKSGDAYNCFIMGRSAENSATAATEGFDLFSTLSAAVVGNFMARTQGQTGASITIGKHGDGIKGSATSYLGTVQYPNAEDTELYLSPVWVIENGTPNIRGRLRGLYQPLHAISNFTDGQTFTGAGDYAGKSFVAVKQSVNAGVFFLETSATLDTN